MRGMMTGQELRVALKRLRIKQKDFADHVGVTAEHVSRMVHDRSKIVRRTQLVVEGMLNELRPLDQGTQAAEPCRLD